MFNKIKIKTIPKKIDKKTIEIFDPIFRQRIFILLNQDENDYVKFLNKHKVKDVQQDKFYFNRVQGFSTYFETDDLPRQYIILLKEFDWSIFHQGTLIHEITHTVIRIFEEKNIPFNNDTQEFIANEISRIYEMVAHKLLEYV